MTSTLIGCAECDWHGPELPGAPAIARDRHRALHRATRLTTRLRLAGARLRDVGSATEDAALPAMAAIATLASRRHR